MPPFLSIKSPADSITVAGPAHSSRTRSGRVRPALLLALVCSSTAALLASGLLPLFPGDARPAIAAAPAEAAESKPAAKEKPEEAEPPYGLTERTAWTGSRLVGSPEPPPPYRLERVFPELTLNQPVELLAIPGTNRLVAVEVTGKVVSFENRPDVKETTLVADLAELPFEEKLHRAYGMTLHPQFEKNRYCYISWVQKGGLPEGSFVSRFTMTSLDPPTIDLATEQTIIRWRSGGHNGGALQFGNDGMLYVSTGDGGNSFPPDGLNNGQDITNLLACTLRIDVDHPAEGMAYSVPADNPFVNHEGARGEIWSYGHRNPWKMCIDPATGHLWVGDVGWELWEMIYRVVPGGNYGWSIQEASQPVHQERRRGPTPILEPTVAHSHIEARSITGGYVYHGQRLPGLKGHYVYGDYVTGKFWSVPAGAEHIGPPQELVDTAVQVVCFGLDAAGELLIVGYDGTIHRLVPNAGASANEDFPRTLSATGLFADAASHTLAAGVLPYSVQAAPWEDGAEATRFVAIPGKGQLGEYDSTNVQIGYIKGMWQFPDDSVLGRTVSIRTRPDDPASAIRLETQLLHFQGDTWHAYNYIWNDDQTDATLADNLGSDRTLTVATPEFPAGTEWTWHHASRTECLLCHSTRGGSIYGFNPAQLNGPRHYAATNVTDNQLRTLSHIGLFRQPVPEQPDTMVDPLDETADLEQRARAWLHVNCAHCHRRGGGGTAAIDIRREYTLKQTNLLNARPTQGTFGMFQAEVVAAGDPARSVLYYRMAKLGRGRMPHFGSRVVDRAGLELMHDWITALGEHPDVEPPSPAALALKQREAAAVAALNDVERPAAEQTETINQLLSTTSGGLRLLAALDFGNLPAATRQLAIASGSKHPNPAIRDLYERFLPPAERTRTLGTSIQPEQILTLNGNAARGEELFLRAAGVQCRNCHKVGQTGKPLGPDLAEIAKKYSRAQLLESMIEPSKKIDPKFAAWLVETSRGLVHTGLLKSRTEEEVVLVDGTGKEIRIAAKDIELILPQQKSLMPELLLRDMTAGQVADLLEYLQSLGKNAPAGKSTGAGG